MRRLAVVLATTVLIGGAPVSTMAANPDIGGDPIYTEQDYFTAGDWGMTAYSYVFDNTSASLPAIYPDFELNTGEMLFMHLLDSDAAKGISVDHFAVGNPELITINTVGWTIDVVPAGYDVDNHQEPYLYGFSGPAEATVYTYTGNLFDPWCTLDPGEYSLVYYIAVSDNYGVVSATANGAGESNNHFVPGPIAPEPTTICLLGLGGLALLRKRRTRAPQ